MSVHLETHLWRAFSALFGASGRRAGVGVLAMVVGLAGSAVAQQPAGAAAGDTATNAVPVPVPDDQTPAAPKPMPTPTPGAPSWVRQGAAVVQVLDKVDAQSATLVVPVGGQLVYRAVTIAVKACAARPVDQAPDATAYVSVTQNGGLGGFTGWLLAAEPAASLMQDPVYDVRLLGCR